MGYINRLHKLIMKLKRFPESSKEIPNDTHCVLLLEDECFELLKV